MSGKVNVMLTTMIVIGALGAGYWLGNRQAPSQASATTALAAAEPAQKPRKLLFYRNPMGLSDTSPAPKKDPMGMDYIPVYEGEEDGDSTDAKQIRISTEKIQKLGVRVEKVSLRTLDRRVRAVGKVDIDERRSYTVAPKFEGWIELLHVNVTGQVVSKGQPLLEVYSPELVSAQREYAIASAGVDVLKAGSSEAQS
ncbi:MAG TPA: efflux RND transporter periplasmic adaptor subunit, partial [Rhodocyclaceae bacterium]|nr:efflux RND transporter periplasmic adaptor subunit [Rhodocyclaceae bacterium]